MARVLSLMAVLVAFVRVDAAPIPKSDPKPKDLPEGEFIRKVLDTKVNLEFTGSNLTAALAQLTEDHRVPFVLDKWTLQQFGLEPNEMTIDFKMKDVKLRDGARAMLAPFNLTTAIVGDSVIITTEEQAIYKQLKHRISVNHDQTPLRQAIAALAKANNLNVVIDPKTIKSKAADEPVTLNVDDVPLEAAIRLMCEMAGLKPTRMGNVIYITTEQRADKLKDSDTLVPSSNGGGVIGGPGILLPAGPNVVPGVLMGVPAEDKPAQP
jgi:hypothetical protein